MNLFFTNLWGIIFASILVFYVQGYGTWKKNLLALFLVVFLLVVTTVPLGGGFYKMYIRELFYNELLALRAHEKKFSEAEIHSIDIRLYKGKYRIHMVMFSNVNRLNKLDEVQQRVYDVADKLSKKLGHKVVIQLNVIPLYHIGSEPDESS